MFKQLERKITFFLIFIEASGGVLFPPLISLLGRERGLSVFEISILFSILSVSLLISGYILGSLSDRFGRKAMLITSAIAGMLGWLVIGQTVLFVGVAIGAALLGIAAACLPVAQSFFTQQESVSAKRTITLGTIGMIVGLSAIVAPLAASFLSSDQYSNLFYILAGFFALETIALYFFFHEDKKFTIQKPIPFSYEKEIESHISLVPGYLAWFIFGIAMSGTNAVFTLYMKEVISLSARDIFFLFTAGGLITALSQNPGIKHFWFKVFNERKIIFLCPIAVAAGFFLMAIPFLPIFLMGYFIEQASRPVFRVTMLSDLAGRVDKKKQGMALGALSSISAVAMIVGPLLFGAIFTLAPSFTLISAGLCTLISIFFIMALLAREEHLTTSIFKLIQAVYRQTFKL